MRVKISGGSDAAKLLRGWLIKASSVVLTDEKPDWTVRVSVGEVITVQGAPGRLTDAVAHDCAEMFGGLTVQVDPAFPVDAVRVSIPLGVQESGARALFRALTRGHLEPIPETASVPIPPPAKKPWWKW